MLYQSPYMTLNAGHFPTEEEKTEGNRHVVLQNDTEHTT